MILEPVPAWWPSHFRVKLATAPWERAACAALRRRVFCAEQGVFVGCDRDNVDERAVPICALSTLAGNPDAVVGTVRIHAADADIGSGEDDTATWWGSRLAVEAGHRRTAALGIGLIRVAVSSARARGCRRFLAHVQAANAPLFRGLHWQSLAEVALHGRPHHLMEADLSAYPPMHDPEHGLVTLRRAA